MEKTTELNKNKGRKRLANFELLRLSSMLLVVSLHYLSKGKALPDFTGQVTFNEYMACFLESVSIVAVNAFVLLSGYFLVKTEFKTKRMIQLIGQVLFYTLLIPVLLILSGILPVSTLNIYTLSNDLFPVQMEHYWFITAYVFLYLCTPLLNAAVRGMQQSQLKAVICVLLFAFALPKTIIPIPLTVDRFGYDFVWFLCVYLIAAYIRLYGILFFTGGRKSCVMYVISVALLFTCTIMTGFVYRATGKLQDQIMEVFQYNHLLNLLAAVSFFYMFYYLKIKANGRLAALICRLSPYALGVYLLHEQLDVRYLWPEWLRVEQYAGTSLFLVHYIGTIAGIFVLGIAVDFLRSLLVRGIARLVRFGTVEHQLEKLDCIINGK